MFENELIDLPKGTKVKIAESSEQKYVGVIGAIRHSFPSNFWDKAKSKYILSIQIDKKFQHTQLLGILNLTETDKYTPVFCNYDKEYDCYYIHGHSFIYLKFPSVPYGKICEKYKAEYNNYLSEYIFKTKEDCENCINYFNKLAPLF